MLVTYFSTQIETEQINLIILPPFWFLNLIKFPFQKNLILEYFLKFRYFKNPFQQRLQAKVDFTSSLRRFVDKKMK